MKQDRSDGDVIDDLFTETSKLKFKIEQTCIVLYCTVDSIE